MSAMCGVDCCEKCSQRKECGGCEKVKGHPFGGTCVAAECIEQGGIDGFLHFKNTLIAEFNGLGIKGLTVNDLNLLLGSFVNLEYSLSNGQRVKLLEDNKVYLGNQIEIPDSERCYGIVGDEAHLLVCQYGCGGSNPEVILYKKRER